MSYGYYGAGDMEGSMDSGQMYGSGHPSKRARHHYGGMPQILTRSSVPRAEDSMFIDNMKNELSTDWSDVKPNFTAVLWAKASDQMNGSFTSNVLNIQTLTIEQFIVWYDAFVELPISVTTLTQQPPSTSLSVGIAGAAAATTLGIASTPVVPNGVGAPYTMAWKNGGWQIFNALQGAFCGQTFTTFANFINSFATFRALVETSSSALVSTGRSSFFYPDTFDSAVLSLDTNPPSQSTGLAICAPGGYVNNNVIDPSIGIRGSYCCVLNPTAQATTGPVILPASVWNGYPCAFQAVFGPPSVASLAGTSAYFQLPNMINTGGSGPSAVPMTLSPNAIVQISCAGLAVSSTTIEPLVYTWCAGAGAVAGNVAAFVPGAFGSSGCNQIRITSQLTDATAVALLQITIWDPSLASPILLPQGGPNPQYGNVNRGLMERAKWTAFAGTPGAPNGLQSSYVQEFRGTYLVGPAAIGGGQASVPYSGVTQATATVSQRLIQVYRFMLTVFLRDISDLFCQLKFPLAKTSVALQFTLNQVNATIINAATVPAPQYANTTFAAGLGSRFVAGACSSSSLLAGAQTCPVVVTNIGTAGNNAVAPATASAWGVGPSLGQASGSVVQLSVFVGNPSNSGSNVLQNAANAFSQTCFMYYPIVFLGPNPDADLALQVQGSVEGAPASESAYQKKMSYLDLQWFNSVQTYPTGTGGPYQFVIQMPTKGIRFILMYPYIALSSMNINEQVNPYASSTTTEPGTMSPQVSLTNIQLQINNVNYYTNPLQYTYEIWLEALRYFFPNDSQDNVIAGGLISFDDWEKGYRVYAFDVSRKNLQDDTGSTITLTFNNNSPFSINLQAHVVVERRLMITYNGQGQLPTVEMLT